MIKRSSDHVEEAWTLFYLALLKAILVSLYHSFRGNPSSFIINNEELM
jgi:hypothetical protein